MTLFTYGPIFDLKDLSPFVIKAHMLLRLARIDYKVNTRGYTRAPKGKLPFIKDEGKIVADSTFIRIHLESTRNIDFDAHLSDPEKATAWAFEKMCEDHLYWSLLDARWLKPSNFEIGPSKFFQDVPALIRPFIKKYAVKVVRKSTKAHGMGRHSQVEIEYLAMRDLGAISDFLGTKKYFMGDKVSGVDATIYAFVSAALCKEFETPIVAYAESRPNLRAYRERIEAEFFPAE